METLLRVDTGLLRRHTPVEVAAVYVDSSLFELSVVQRAAYALLGRLDVEIHPFQNRWLLYAARVPDSPMKLLFPGMPLQTATEWEIGSALVEAYVTHFYYTGNMKLREGIIAAAFTDTSVDMWELFKKTEGRPRVLGPGKSVARVEEECIAVARDICPLTHIMIATSKLLKRSAVQIKVDGEDINIRVHSLNSIYTDQALLEELCQRINSRNAELNT